MHREKKKYTYTPLKPPFSPAKLQLIWLSTPENRVSAPARKATEMKHRGMSIPLLYRVGIYSIFWSFVLGHRFKWLKTQASTIVQEITSHFSPLQPDFPLTQEHFFSSPVSSCSNSSHHQQLNCLLSQLFFEDHRTCFPIHLHNLPIAFLFPSI